VEIRSGNIVRQVLAGSGAVSFPSTSSFTVGSGGVNRFEVSAGGQTTMHRTTGNSASAAVISSVNAAGRTYAEFTSPNTASMPSVGCVADDLEFRVSSTTRQEIRAAGQTVFPNTTTFLVQNGTGDTFRIKPNG